MFRVNEVGERTVMAVWLHVDQYRALSRPWEHPRLNWLVLVAIGLEESKKTSFSVIVV